MPYRGVVRAALLSLCLIACCHAQASANADTPDRVYDFTDRQSFTVQSSSIFFGNDEFYCPFGFEYDSYDKCLKLRGEEELDLPRYDSPIAKIEICSALGSKSNASLSVARVSSGSEIEVKQVDIYQDDPYENFNIIEIPEEFDSYSSTHDLVLKNLSTKTIYIQQMKVYFRKSESAQPIIKAEGNGYGDKVTVNAPGCSWIRVNVSNKNGIGRERTIRGDVAEFRLLEADAFGGELLITATASPQTGTEIENEVRLTLPALSLTKSEMTPVFAPEDLTALTAPTPFSYTFEGTRGWHHYYAVKTADVEVNPYFDYIPYTAGTPIVGVMNSDILLMIGINSTSSTCYTTTETIGIKQPENNATCRYDAVTEAGDIREMEYGATTSGRNAFYNYYVLAANDRSGNVAVMSDTRAETGYVAIRTSGTEAISAGTGAAEFGLAGTGDGQYRVIVTGSGYDAAASTTRDDAFKELLAKTDTRVLPYSDFEAGEAVAATAAADGWTVTTTGLSHDTTHCIVYDAANHAFACSCTVAEADRIPTYLAANLKGKNGGLNTGVNEITSQSAEAGTEHPTEWYTLQGIRLPEAPTAPGLYIRKTPSTTRLHQIR